jgi:choline-sulfatase
VAWIRAAQGPWLAWVHVYDPHEPYAAPEPFASRYTSAPYDGEVAYTDSVLGRMLGDLETAGRLDRTLVVITADHGEGLGDHGERTHGLFAYESTLHLPLIMWCRDRIRRSQSVEPAGLVDVAPTVLDLLGVAPMAGDGRSLRAQLTGETASGAATHLTYFETLNANLTRNWAPLTGIISGGLKLVDLPVPELYDLSADPSESQNLYARRTEDARRLEALLDTAAGDAPAASASVDTETAARLRSLGYIVAQTQNRQRKFTAADDPKNLIKFEAALDEAMKIAGRGDASGAIAMLQDVIRQRPDLPVAYDRLAFVLRSSGRLPEAIDVLEQAAAKGFADGPALVSLGTMLGEAGRVDRSAEVLEAAIKLSPNDLEAQANLGVLYLRMGKRDQAIATLQRALDADPRMVGARNTLAVAYAQTGNLARAVEQWRQLALVRPDDPDILFNIGTALLQLKRPSEAQPFLERFIAVAPPRYADDVERVRQMIAAIGRGEVGRG